MTSQAKCQRKRHFKLHLHNVTTPVTRVYTEKIMNAEEHLIFQAACRCFAKENGGLKIALTSMQ